MRLARAEERRQGVAVLRVDMATQLAAREVEARYELDVVRPKKPLPLTPTQIRTPTPTRTLTLTLTLTRAPSLVR